MAWQNLREDLAEEFSGLEGFLPGKYDQQVTHTAYLPNTDHVNRWRAANPERWKAICRRYREKNRESINAKKRACRQAHVGPCARYAKKLKARFAAGEISELVYRLEMGRYDLGT